MSEDIHIQFTRFSAFYSPLIVAIAGGWLEREGLRPRHSVAPAGKSALAALADGSAQVVQSAPSQAIVALDRGEVPAALHFAQINETDGFFLVGRRPEPDFDWTRLAGREVLVDHGEQPLAMFRYACFRRGADFAAIRVVDAGPPERMIEAFRAGRGDYVHLQGPAPQQLEFERCGHVVAAVGAAVGPCAFSSLAARRAWLATEAARAFMRAYRKARAWLIAAPAREVAALEAPLFPEVAPEALAAAIAAYQKLGTWTPHVEITRAAYEATLEVFRHAGRIRGRPRYEDAVAPPPAD
ncbi:MAG: ABC transporter substrate-binding protein [Burkholderiales bacterium]|nr:ABC transporter substrate-binding protein [Burkholderiales bacterium]